MARGLIGKKLGMTQIFDQDGNLVPVTVIELTPNHVLQVKTKAGKDGYDAVKLAAGEVKAKNLSKPELGVFKAVGVQPKKAIVEFRLTAEQIAGLKTGDQIDASIFAEGNLVNVVGTSKGKGFAGVMKRHGFKGAKEMTHGTHEYERHGGSIGANTWPGRVFKNKRMAGQMGNGRVTVRNIKVVGVHPDEHLLLLKGAVPGAAQSLVQVYETKPKKAKIKIAPTKKK
ncbi:MAG: 50S ribosomal protein L3 [Deltaproteobacteria bacterium]|nr:50S ribosomal protein L3 [Deltaproteobacteria bacterium]